MGEPLRNNVSTAEPEAGTPANGELAPERFWALYGAAAFGAFCLGLGDLLNNGNASMVLKLGEIVRQHLLQGMASSGLVAILLLIFLGGAICWLHQPQTRVDAFARGFSVFALLAVATPYNAPSPGLDDPGMSLEGPNPVTTAPAKLPDSWSGGGAPLWITAALVPAAQGAVTTQVMPAQAQRVATARVYLVAADGGTPVDRVLVTLRGPNSAKVLASETLTDHVAKIVKPVGTYWVELEKSGYQRVRFRLSLSGNKTWKVEMPRSKVPLNFQRLGAAEVIQPTPYRP